MRSLKPLRNYLHISIWLLGCSLTNPSQKTSPAVSIHSGSSFIQLSIHTETINSFLGLKQTACSTLDETASYLKLSGCCPAWSRLVHRPVRLTYRWFDSNGRRLVRVDAVSRQSHRLDPEYILFIGLQAMNCKPERRKPVFSTNIGSLLNQIKQEETWFGWWAYCWWSSTVHFQPHCSTGSIPECPLLFWAPSTAVGLSC